jgi:chromosome segregation protein
MAYIKKMVMQGFKSFAKKTEVLFDRGINTVIGPNGSGKSNISDALCFALGRLSIKSMRAAKAKNLIFMGSKIMKPMKEASVEIIFDNKDRAFNMDKDEVILKRIVRANGQSAYKIEGETKTRGEIIELLAHAGIDPYGFNIILQGHIQSIVRIQSEERRKIIEEVAGISIYETRKEKSLHELEKTEEKLKEISSVIRERAAYLRNLEEEKKQALKYKELEKTLSRAKASILNKRKEEKEKELKLVRTSLEKNMGERDRRKSEVERVQGEVEQTAEKINLINKHIQQSTGMEQEQLHSSIANLKADIEGLKVRKENHEHRKEEIERRIVEVEKSIPSLEEEIEELREKSPMMAKKAEELKKKKEELAKLEEERKKALTLKAELNGLKERIKDKERRYTKVQAESEEVVKSIEEQGAGVVFKTKDSCEKAIAELNDKINEKKKEKEALNEKRIEHEKIISASEFEIERVEKIKKDVSKIDVCPLCQSKITKEHAEHVTSEAEAIIVKCKNEIENARERISDLEEEKDEVDLEITEIEKNLADAKEALVFIRSANEKQHRIKILVDEEKQLLEELNALNKNRESLESRSSDISYIQEKYDNKLLEIEEISSRTEEDVDTTIIWKSRDLENMRNVVKRSRQDAEEIEEQADEIANMLEEKEKELEKAEKQEDELSKKFKKLFADRDALQSKIQEKNIEIADLQNQIRQTEDQMNYLKIGKAKLEAEEENILMEMQEFVGIELLPGSIEALREKMQKTQFTLQQIGSINMRALEVYEEVKKEYDKVQDKVNILQKEKEEIIKIVEEIDKKKKKTFMKTFNAINELFTQNFTQLSSKGQAYLEIENKEDVFAGGITIVVKLAKGKYFDVSSLSGGEQTLVALSLLFAIQEYKPYHFYIFDEIDAALDKRNSERLAALLEKHMQRGQYIVVTHNDAIIINSHVLYGVSMYEGISKVLSLKVNDANMQKKES